MKKRINLTKITTFALLITVTTLILVAGTYAKYTSSASGTDATVVANWSFMVNDADIAVKGSAPTIDFNLFETINDITTGEKETNVADGLIAPGTTGDFEFKLHNSSDVTTKYAINLSVDNTSIPLEFSLGDDAWVSITNLEDLAITDVMAIDSKKDVTVQWRWAFDGETDATLGGQTVTVTANITATQVDSGKAPIVEQTGEWLYPNVSTYEEEGLDAYYSTNPNDLLNYQHPPIVLTSYELTENKKIEKIKLPVISVTQKSDKYTFTISVLKENFITSAKVDENLVSEHNIDLTSYIGTLETTAVKKWIVVDLSGYNIVVKEGEILGFGKSDNNVIIGIDRKNHHNQFTEFNFYLPTYKGNSAFTQNVFLDLYVTDLNENKGYTGKKLSILGDSISTYQGYSNDANSNTTLGSNAVNYNGSNNGVSNVNETWWMQLANETGMEILVNNSYSGDTLALKGVSRSNELHNDTGESEVNPDVVVVYFGVNDIKNGTSLSDFENYYNQVVENITTNYKDAEVYLLTHVPFVYANGVKINTPENLELLESYNDVIREIANASSEDNVYLTDYYANSEITMENYGTYANDGLHPNTLGMDVITQVITNSLQNK